MARGITVEDLTRGLLNYRYTGLTFTKGDRGALKCVNAKVCWLVVYFTKPSVVMTCWSSQFQVY